MNRSDITLLVLCGGEGRRAGGSDKPLLVFKGQTILAHILAALAPAVENVLVSANRNLDAYRAYGYPVQEDELPFEGPLAALASCKPYIDTPWVLVCPGDNPLVGPGLLKALLTEFESSCTPPDVLLIHDQERVQPLYFLGRSSCLPEMKAALGERRAIMHWMDTLVVRQVKLEETFPNINTQQDLKNLERLGNV